MIGFTSGFCSFFSTTATAIGSCFSSIFLSFFSTAAMGCFFSSNFSIVGVASFFISFWATTAFNSVSSNSDFKVSTFGSENFFKGSFEGVSNLFFSIVEGESSNIGSVAEVIVSVLGVETGLVSTILTSPTWGITLAVALSAVFWIFSTISSLLFRAFRKSMPSDALKLKISSSPFPLALFEEK